MSFEQAITLFGSGVISFLFAGCLTPVVLFKFRPAWKKPAYCLAFFLAAVVSVVLLSDVSAYTTYSIFLTSIAGALVAGFVLGLLLTLRNRKLKFPIVLALTATIAWQWDVILFTPVLAMLPAVLPEVNERLPSGLICRVENTGLGFAAAHTASLISPIGLGFGIEISRNEIGCDDTCGQASISECFSDEGPQFQSSTQAK